jgi:hypothetical protein
MIKNEKASKIALRKKISSKNYQEKRVENVIALIVEKVSS